MMIKMKTKTIFLIINSIVLTLGHCGGPLITRLYFNSGGKRVWLLSWLQTAGWPVILAPLMFLYVRRRGADGPGAKVVFMKSRVFFSTAAIGLLTGVDDYLYAFGVSKLPVSTVAIIIATQLAFTAGFAYVLCKQKFTAFSVNAVVLLSIGAGVLAMHTSGDRPDGVSTRMYVMGFLMTLGAAALYGLILPAVEFMYMKAKQPITYTLVMEIQLVMCFFATSFSTVGMLVNKDFQALGRDSKVFELGEDKYYVVLVFSALLWQCFFLGAIGVIHYSSSLLLGILIAVVLPITEILAVIFYHERFQVEKVVALILSLWGFTSYLYGEMKNPPEKGSFDSPQQIEITDTIPP